MVVILVGLESPLRTRNCSGMNIISSIDLTFITPEGESKTVKARIGDTVLDTAKSYNLPVCGRDST